MRATIRDVAKASGVSVTAASRALNNKDDLAPETRARILAAAEELNYVPNSVARALVLGRSKTLGVVLNNNASPVYAEVLQGIEQAANAAGFGVLLFNSADSQEQALRGIDTFYAKQVDGILLTPVQSDQRDIQQLQRCGLPYVLVLRHFPGLENDYVIADNEEAGYISTIHLLDLGHRRIGHVSGPEHASTSQGRLQGYRRALAERNIPFDETLVSHSLFTVAGGYEGSFGLLDRPDRPTAVFAATDLLALGVFRAARELGLQIPNDLALTGGDDVEFAEFLEVPLTTFHIPLRDIGGRAAEILLARINGEAQTAQQVVLTPTLVVRRSSGNSIA